ncbi:MAG: spore coat protein [Myxococcales bacterium]|nr:spore coat protein [Myxococcales bacterium]|tara:strand:- start:877 stop:1617 length:741 start_codon:yes stop_codon:yes gene_type:complete
MKGIILAGGMGTRLSPLTRVTNKHLLPVYDCPMIYYPLRMLVTAGFEEIMIVTGGDHAGDFLKLLGNGSEFGLKHLNYTYQKGHGGIAEALGLCAHWVDRDPCCVVLGDNIFQYSLAPAVEQYRQNPVGAQIFIKEVPDPHRFGVAELADNRVIHVEEKPQNPRSNWAITGVYCYDARVFDIIDGLEPSARGELEITDVNRAYLEWGDLRAAQLDGWWTDAGTFNSLLRAGQLVAETGANQPAPSA